MTEGEELAAAPDPELLHPFEAASLSQVNQMVKDRAQDQRLESRANQDIWSRLAAWLVGSVAAMDHMDRVIAVGGRKFVKIGPESQHLVGATAARRHFDRGKWRVIDDDAAALRRSDQPVFAVLLAPEDGREQLGQGFPVDGRAAVEPSPIRRDADVKVAAKRQIGEPRAGLWVGHGCG